jgi:hypothetical protein
VPRARGAARDPAAEAAERATAVAARKRQRLLDLGLAPPADSPFASGRVAPNAALLARCADWEREAPEVVAAGRHEAAALFAQRG